MSQLITRGIGPAVSLPITRGLGVFTIIEGTIHANGIPIAVIPPGGRALVSVLPAGEAVAIYHPDGRTAKVIFAEGDALGIIVPAGRGHVLNEEE